MSVVSQPVAATPAAASAAAPSSGAPASTIIAAPPVPSGPTLGAVIAAAAPKPDVAPPPPAPSPPPAPAAPAPIEVKLAEPKVETPPPAPPAKTEPPKAGDDLGKLLARIEAQDSVIAEMKAQLTRATEAAEAARGDVRGRLVDELLASAELQPKYYKQARVEIGDLDPKSDAAKARLDEFVRQFPEALLPRSQQRTPDSTWLNRVADQQKDPKAARGTMLGAISASDLAAQLAAVRRT